MADYSPEELALWQRRLASQANNRAWHLSESSTRSSEQDDEMLQAAHAAMHLWKIVGSVDQRAHAALLLAHAHALLALPSPARHYWAQCEPRFLAQACKPWEKALALAVQANVAAASGESETHAASYREADRSIQALPDAEDRDILNATLRVVPKPAGGRVV